MKLLLLQLVANIYPTVQLEPVVLPDRWFPAAQFPPSKAKVEGGYSPISKSLPLDTYDYYNLD